MTDIEVNIVSPILYCGGTFSLAAVTNYFNILQYLFRVIQPIHPQKNISAWLAKANTYFSFINFLQDTPQKSPNMDVVILDTFLNPDHKTEDTET